MLALIIAGAVLLAFAVALCVISAQGDAEAQELVQELEENAKKGRQR